METYAARIAKIHRALGISRDYAKKRRLPLVSEATEADLVPVSSPLNGHSILLLAPAAAAWDRLALAAAADQLMLLPLSGFRSVARQEEIIRGKLSAGKTIEEILRVNAAPGCSEHHSGCAIDIGSPAEEPLTERFEHSAAYSWLAQRAGEFGFHLSYPRDNPHEIAYEPWHWCWRQKD